MRANISRSTDQSEPQLAAWKQGAQRSIAGSLTMSSTNDIKIFYLVAKAFLISNFFTAYLLSISVYRFPNSELPRSSDLHRSGVSPIEV